MPPIVSVSIPDLTELPSPVVGTNLLPINIPDGVNAGTYRSDVDALLTYIAANIPTGNQAFVAITDITPTNPSDNVGNKVKTDDNNVLQSCTSSTTEVTVAVLAVTGSTFKPSVSVNGVAATLSRNALTDVWQGSAAITLTGSSPHTVTAMHGDGAVDTAVVTIESAPVVSSVLFSAAYSQGVGQTEHAAGQTLTLTVTSATPFVELDVIGDGTTAVVASNTTFAAATSKSLTVTVANHGNTPTAYPAKVRVRNANGTWSAIVASNVPASVDGANVVTLNNTQPIISFGSITYPSTQSALKDSESATVSVTESNVSTVSYTSPNSELSIASPTVLGNKTVTRSAGGYNISANNLQVVANKTSNATSGTFSIVVWIANDLPSVSITTPAVRLRSGVTPESHTITLTSTQRVSNVSLSNSAGFGSFVGSWGSANNGMTWTKVLQVADSDTKGSATFSSLSATNLAGRVVTTITGSDSYNVGGFVARTVTMGSFNPLGNRKVDILTNVVTPSLVLVTNLSKAGLAMSYANSLTDAVDSFAIVDAAGSLNAASHYLYNRDKLNAESNLSGTAQFIIEETVS